MADNDLCWLKMVSFLYKQFQPLTDDTVPMARRAAFGSAARALGDIVRDPQFQTRPRPYP